MDYKVKVNQNFKERDVGQAIENLGTSDPDDVAEAILTSALTQAEYDSMGVDEFNEAVNWIKERFDLSKYEQETGGLAFGKGGEG